MTRTAPLLLLMSILLILPPGMTFAADSDSRKTMDTVRRGNYEEFKKERERRNRQKKYEQEREERKEARKRRKRDREYEREDSDDHHGRTMGQSCVYGKGGIVIFRPRGGWCKGDPLPEGYAEQMQQQQQEPAFVPAGIAPDQPRKKSRRKKKAKGRCIYSGGRLVFAPADMDCPQ